MLDSLNVTLNESTNRTRRHSLIADKRWLQTTRNQDLNELLPAIYGSGEKDGLRDCEMWTIEPLE
jgi:hypothetical protein